MHPVVASRAGTDESICGTCPHRQLNGGKRSCYVNLIFGPKGVWEAYQAGKYVPYDRDKHQHHFQGRLLRAGAYGDPVAAPSSMWEHLLDLVYQATSYTHMWRLGLAAPFRDWTMASVDDPVEREEAKAMGWRTYRVASDPLENLKKSKEVWCPATESGGNRVQCDGCMACDGNARGSDRVDIVSPAHGSGAGHYRAWSEIRMLQRQGFTQTELSFD